jgi:hypothetical protein
VKLPSALAQLGTVLDVRVEKDGKRERLSWPRGSLLLCADSSEKRLWLVPAPGGRSRKLTDAQRTKDVESAARVVKRWSDFEAGTVTAAKVSLGKEKLRGRVVSIGYRSDKWSGKAENYEHECEGPMRLRQFGTVYVISGGGLRITPSGIQG